MPRSPSPSARWLLPSLALLMSCSLSAAPGLALLGGCGRAPTRELKLEVGDRVASAYVPEQASGPLPVVLLLHGYGTTGARNDLYLGLHEAAASRGMATIVPDGIVDDDGERYWNAFDSCCDFDHRGIDDVAYLLDLLDALSEEVETDPAHTYIVGYSNGGFMAFRAACEHPERFAAIAPWVGSLDANPEACAPSEPLSLVHVRNVEDETILYEGGEIRENPYLGARDSAARWAELAGCSADTTPGDERDMVRRPGGPETTVERWVGCPEGIDVELWSVGEAGHVPRYEPDAAEQVLDFLLAHEKPPA